MQLTVKTLKGEKFVVEAEPSSTVGQVKTIIVSMGRAVHLIQQVHGSHSTKLLAIKPS